jgi:chromosome partitioning protein
MIVICQNCHSRFNLDERRVKSSRFIARCSRCQHIFSAYKPARAEAIPFLDLAAARTRQGGRNIIAISNQKGGVAKTSTCLNLGACLAQQGRRVLLIDFDVQANLTLSLGGANGTSFYDAVMHPERPLGEVLTPGPFPNLWLLPANKNMVLLAKKFFGVRHYEFILKDRLRALHGRFDYVLIDTPPSIEFFTLNALTAADRVIIPTQCDYLSTHGVDQILDIISLIRHKTNPAIEARILVTMYDAGLTAARVIFSKIQDIYRGVTFRTAIDYDPRLREAQIMSQPVIHYDPGSRSSRQYQALAREIEAPATS